MAKRFVSYEEREEFFELVCSGFSLQGAAEGAGVSVTAGALWWRASGLMDPVIQVGACGGLPGSAPARVPGPAGAGGAQMSPPRRRRPLTSEDRAVVAAGLQARWSHRRIGEAIGRDKSVVCREVARNRGPGGSYWAPIAHRAAHERRRRPKPLRLVENPGLCRRIEAWMDAGWSPRLIASALKADHPHMIMERVSHETIYQ